jgi:hypothetical protein
MMRLLLKGIALLLGAVSIATAQTGTSPAGYGTALAHRFEVIPFGGYCWSGSQDVVVGSTAGQIDFDDAGYWGVALDVNLAQRSAETGQLRLLYRRSDSQVQFRSYGLPTQHADAAVEYYQIGGVGGYPRGKAMPFAAMTVGGARLVGPGGDAWKFSMLFGLGVKVYVSPKVGLMLQGNFPFIFTDTWGGAAFGTGGATVAIGGTGIAQIDVGGGVVICF